MNTSSIKDSIKRNPLFQYANAAKYNPMTKERFQSQPQDEVSKERICTRKKHKIDQIENLLSSVNITIDSKKRYQNWIDTGLICPALGAMVDNIPPNYSLVINNSLVDLESYVANYNNQLSHDILRLLSAVDKYIDRIIREIDDKIKQDETKNGSLKSCKSYFCRMKTHKAESLDEAFQRILFWSSIFWQSRHRLVGLGRLDKILSRFEGEADSIEKISCFYKELHRYYHYKSNKVSLGDTGQIIIIGGLEPDGSYYFNSLTYSFLNAVVKTKLPDPKLLLRVSNSMPDDLLQLAIDVISFGTGSPLLSNDDTVIPSLEKFGYTHEDACNYVVSACWEPLVYGKSLEKNNILDINYANSLCMMYDSEAFKKCGDFNDVLSVYYSCLLQELQRIKDSLDSIQWEEDPLMSLFTDDCLKSGKDIAQGGAVYSDYGVLTVGLANTVNSLFNIERLVFKENKGVTLQLLSAAASNDFVGYENLQAELTDATYFGHDDPNVIRLVESIKEFVEKNLGDYRNKFGGRVKWGLSSSNYAEVGKCTPATLDGRRSGQPLAVHISSGKGVAYTELISFASELTYAGNNSNGNVVDLIVSPTLIASNKSKFYSFVKAAIIRGVFQMQFNVVDSATLIKARENPGDFPNLIVRVWGFSAYFNDLPDYYKDLLIERAIESEKL